MRDLDAHAWWRQADAARALGLVRAEGALRPLLALPRRSARGGPRRRGRGARPPRRSRVRAGAAAGPARRLAPPAGPRRRVHPRARARCRACARRPRPRPSRRSRHRRRADRLHRRRRAPPTICWPGRATPTPAVRAAALQALGSLGLDDRAYYYALRALGDADARGAGDGRARARALAPRRRRALPGPAPRRRMAGRGARRDGAADARPGGRARARGAPGGARPAPASLARQMLWERRSRPEAGARHEGVRRLAAPRVRAVRAALLLRHQHARIWCSRCWPSSSLRQHRRRWTTRELESVVRSPATPGVSVIAPAYNEEATIVESMRGAAAPQLPALRGDLRQRRLEGRHAAAGDRGLRAGRGADGGRRRAADGEGARRSTARSRTPNFVRDRQGERRQGGRAQRRHQRGALSAVLRDRRRLAARAEHALAHVVRPFLEDRPTRSRAAASSASSTAARSRRPRDRGRRCRRTRWRSSRWSSTCAPSSAAASAGVGDQRAADHLRRLRRVPPRGRGRGRRLPRRHHRRGHGAVSCACTAAAASAEQRVPRRVPAGSGVLDRGAGEPPRSLAQPAQALAARPVPGARLSPRA